MRILAIDPATNCGWAIGDVSFFAPTWGVWDLSTRRDESTGMKLLRLESKLMEIHKNGIALIVFEAARHAMPKMQGALVHQAKLQGIIERFAERKNIPCRGYSSKEIKLYATGKGNTSKDQVIAAARTRFGYDGNDDNEADALSLCHLAHSEYGAALLEKRVVRNA